VRYLKRSKVSVVRGDFDYIVAPVPFPFPLDSLPFTFPALGLHRGIMCVVRRGRWDWGLGYNPLRFQHICDTGLNSEPLHLLEQTTHLVSDTGSGRSAKGWSRCIPP